METLCASMKAILLLLSRGKQDFLRGNHKVADRDN